MLLQTGDPAADRLELRLHSAPVAQEGGARIVTGRHGVGMTGEYPYIVHREDNEAKGYDGVIEPGMTLCIESYIGHEAGGEGVKLEEQVYVRDDGRVELLSDYPFEARLLA